MTQNEIEKRFAQINARTPEHLTAEEAAHLAEAERIDDGSTISLDDLKKELAEYSGRLVLRIPRSLHKTLKEAAAVEESFSSASISICSTNSLAKKR